MWNDVEIQNNLLIIGGFIMKVVTYMCENCFEPHVFRPEDKREEYLCPKCSEKMMYWGTEDIDPTTNKVVNRYDETDRKNQSPGKPVSSEFKHLNPPTITCPYCQSTDCKKISGLSKAGSVALWGIFALGKTTKQWHCNNFKSDF